MKCNYCDYSVSEGTIYCPNCGFNVNAKKVNKLKKEDKIESNSGERKIEFRGIDSTTGSAIGWGVLGFFIPLVGLILFLVWNSTRPTDAKGAGIGALARVAMTFMMILFITFISVLRALFN